MTTPAAPATGPTVHPGAAGDEACAAEPIRVPGSIQPHGVLLGIDPAGRVALASDNTGRLLGRPVARVLGAPAAEVLGVDQLAAVLAGAPPASSAAPGAAGPADAVGGPLRLRLPAVSDGGTGPTGPAAPAATPFEAGLLAGAEVDVLVHRSGGLLVVELEPVLDALGSGAISYRAARAALARIGAAPDVETLCDVLAGEVHALTGFDRVMVYRFDADWNGEVVAERCAPGLEPFLGLRYPASDIPAQARALYVQNWTRLIADVGYTPSALVPGVDADGAPLDLSRSVLRSVSPVHLQYLATLGVAASMSLSLVRDGRLWGLVACHHRTPLRPSFDARSAAEFLAQVASGTIEDREDADARDAARLTQARLEQLTAEIGRRTGDPVDAVLAVAGEARALLGADAVALGGPAADGSDVRAPDTVVDPDVAARIAGALAGRPGDPAADVVTTDRLADRDPDVAALADGIAGAVRLDLGDGRWLLFLRHELPHAVDWGGDPGAKTLTGAAAGAPAGTPTYGPRQSFARWREVVRGRSAPWAAHHVQAATDLREFLVRTAVRRSREQLFVAESLSRALVMPVAPTIPGVELATRYTPSFAGVLGGDWWDVVPVGGHRYALVVGDVSGHGLDAAATMAQIRTSLRTYLLDGTGPSEALDRLDRTVASLMRRTIATCVIAVVDPLAGTVALVGAAALPPVLVGPGGARQVTVANRPPLGVRQAAGLAPTTLSLDDGETLLLFSDGLVERRDREIDDTTAELLTVLATPPPGAPGAPGALDAWLGGVVERRTGDGTDDTTVLAARLRD